MKYLILIAAAVALTTGAAAAAELPTYQAQGFPITSHQVAVRGAAGVEQQSAAATDMPAATHQIAVLTPRAMKVGQQAAAQPIRLAQRCDKASQPNALDVRVVLPGELPTRGGARRGDFGS